MLSYVDIRNGNLVSCLESAGGDEMQFGCAIEKWPSGWVTRVGELYTTGAT